MKSSNASDTNGKKVNRNNVAIGQNMQGAWVTMF